jgi:hypothetical protein
VRLHTADVTRLRAEIRATAPAAIGEAADELMEHLISATTLRQAPPQTTGWDALWDSATVARRRFDAAAGTVTA